MLLFGTGQQTPGQVGEQQGMLGLQVSRSHLRVYPAEGVRAADRSTLKKVALEDALDFAAPFHTPEGPALACLSASGRISVRRLQPPQRLPKACMLLPPSLSVACDADVPQACPAVAGLQRVPQAAARLAPTAVRGRRCGRCRAWRRCCSVRWRRCWASRCRCQPTRTAWACCRACAPSPPTASSPWRACAQSARLCPCAHTQPGDTNGWVTALQHPGQGRCRSGRSAQQRTYIAFERVCRHLVGVEV